MPSKHERYKSMVPQSDIEAIQTKQHQSHDITQEISHLTFIELGGILESELDINWELG